MVTFCSTNTIKQELVSWNQANNIAQNRTKRRAFTPLGSMLLVGVFYIQVQFENFQIGSTCTDTL